jgi:hypothetical protein
MRIIFAGSSALSSRSVTLAAMMSRVREKIPMSKLLLYIHYAHLPGRSARDGNVLRPGVMGVRFRTPKERSAVGLLGGRLLGKADLAILFISPGGHDRAAFGLRLAGNRLVEAEYHRDSATIG